MPSTYSYPGVYVEEVPSGVHTIAGVSTSDTAFVDFFARGPVNDPQRITSFGDFERVFGGLDERSEASFALQQYYRNGGSVAWVVRVDTGGTPAGLMLQGASPLEDSLLLAAANPGLWGMNLQAGVDHKTSDPATLFNLVIREVRVVNGRNTVVDSEVHRNLSMDETHPRYAVTTVNEASRMVTLADAGLGERPVPTGTDVTAPGVLGDAANAAFTPFEDLPDIDGGSAVAAGDGAAPDSNALIAGMHTLDTIAPFVFNLLVIPAAANLEQDSHFAVLADAEAYCLEKRAFLIADIPEEVATPGDMADFLTALEGDGLRSRNAAVYFPRLTIADRLKEDRPRNVGASGTMAGIYARTDATRGVWKAPAGTEATLNGASLVTRITDGDNGGLNPLGVNALRSFPIYGGVAWGARTLDGADQQASEWKYIPVRRLALYLEESLFQGLKWVVFEPNDEPLWGQIRLNAGAFMQNLFRQGAFQGKTPREAYLVKCDSETTTQNDIDRGIVNIVVGFAPLKPAEFVVIRIQQLAGQTQA
ncbi:phage tail sheath family protein [Longimicrobium sp.]|uniref:phage tail sheath family protein n=1 Tax=Longimicrobium sp. TaxID=2029185 RepID=UPI002D037915|nr:phage tail sheath C-terminal domain-containing protein [Longimicrobium sp.]HSU13648.1 phage tail sheath C-terminal domain-containing protein [Longimicrobium sp.]